MPKTMWDSLEETARRCGTNAHSVEYIGLVDLSQFPNDLQSTTTFMMDNKKLLNLPDTTVVEHGTGKLLIAVFKTCYIARKGSRWVAHYIPSPSKWNRDNIPKAGILNEIPGDMIRKEKAADANTNAKPETVQA